MPLRCVDEHGTIFEAPECSDEEWDSLREQGRKERNLRMPCCPARAVLKTSKLGTRFFAHRAKGGCNWKPETDVHLHLKALALATARQTGWEARTEVTGHTPGGEKWTADVLAWKGNEKIAVEIQWSGQTNEETWRRQRRYQRSGIRGVWLLRQPGFPIAAELPAACIGGTMKEGLRILIPKFGSTRAHDRKNSIHWLQNLSPEEFLKAVFEKRLLFGTGHLRTISFGIETGVMACWRCNALTRIVTGVSGRAGPHSLFFRLQEDGCTRTLAKLIQECTRLRTDIGTIKPRYSYTLGHSYLSNGCAQCDAIIGQFYEHHAWYVQEDTIGTVELEIDPEARHQGLYESNRWGVWTEAELEIGPVERQESESRNNWQTITIEGAGSATVRTSPVGPLRVLESTLPSDAPSCTDEEKTLQKDDDYPGFRIQQNFPSPPASDSAGHHAETPCRSECTHSDENSAAGPAGFSILSDFQLPGSVSRR